MAEKNQDYQFQLTWLPQKTFEVLATILQSEIEAKKEKVIAEAGAELEIKGFRKGKAPKTKVIETLGQNKILKLILEEIIPEVYQTAIAHLGLRPILSPKIELVSVKENEDWQVKFTSCEESEVKLGDYKNQLKTLKSTKDIWTPGKQIDSTSKSPTQNNGKDKEEKLDRILRWLTENIKIEISNLLIETEVTRKLSELVDQTQKLGLTVEQYLTSVGKSAESLKEEYKKQVAETLTLQFILEKIANEEKIEIKPEEIEKSISQAKNEEEKEALSRQKYLLASLLRQQKTLDFLSNL